MGFNTDFLKKFYKRYYAQLDNVFHEKKIIDCILSKVFMFNAYIQLVKSNMDYYKVIPEKYRSDQLMFDAVVQSTNAFKNNYSFKSLYVRHMSKYNFDIPKIVYEHVPSLITDLSKLPLDMFSEKLCLSVLRNHREDGSTLAVIANRKPEYFTTDFFLKWMIDRGYYVNAEDCYNMVTKYNDDQQIHKLAFRQGVVSALPKIQNQTQEMWSRYANHNRDHSIIPKQFKLDQLYIDKIISNKNCYYVWKQLPDGVLTKEFVLKCVTQDWETMCRLPGKYKLKKVCMAAINQSPMAIQYLPKRFKTRKLCNECFNKDPKVFEYIQDEHKDEEMCFLAVKHNSNNLKRVPLHLLSENIAIEAINKKIECIKDIPSKCLTFNMCMAHYEKWCTSSDKIDGYIKKKQFRWFSEISNKKLREQIVKELIKRSPKEMLPHIPIYMEDVYFEFASS